MPSEGLGYLQYGPRMTLIPTHYPPTPSRDLIPTRVPIQKFQMQRTGSLATLT